MQNEGDVQVSLGGKPYGIDFGSLLPRKAECTNLTVSICVGSSHIAFGSIRMEPVFMILGQSAATATVFAMDGKHDVQDVDYEKLKRAIACGWSAITQSVGLPLHVGGNKDTQIFAHLCSLSITINNYTAQGKNSGFVPFVLPTPAVVALFGLNNEQKK